MTAADLNEDEELAFYDEEVATAEAMLQEARLRRAVFVQGRVLADLSLRDWQSEALIAWQAQGSQGIVEAVTGAGKTRVGIGAVALAHKVGMRSVVLVPGVFLMDQWVEELNALLPDLRVAKSSDRLASWDVCVTTVQTAYQRDLLATGVKALLVADEVHRYGAERYAEALRDNYVHRLGLSATSERGDEGDETIEQYFGDVCFKLDYGRALADGLISPYVFGFLKVPLTTKERVDYTDLTHRISRTGAKLVAQHDFPADDFASFIRMVHRAAASSDRDSGLGKMCQTYVSAVRDRRALLASAKMKLGTLSSLAPAINKSNGVIVFTQTTEASKQAAEVVNVFGARAQAIYSVMPVEDRAEALVRFRDRGQTGINVLAAPKILDEGVDVPEADLGIVMAANRNRRQMIQRLGRVLRRRPDKIARFVVMCAQDTVEDPDDLSELDYYDEIVPYALDSGVFDAADSTDQVNLLKMLGGETLDEAPVQQTQSDPVIITDQTVEHQASTVLEVVEDVPQLPQPIIGEGQRHYRLKGRGERSLGYLLSDGRFRITRGNELLHRGRECGVHGMDLSGSPSERCSWIAKTRTDLLAQGVLGWLDDGRLIFFEDHVFPNADDAADVIRGKDVDGFTEWEDAKSRPLHQSGAIRRVRPFDS